MNDRQRLFVALIALFALVGALILYLGIPLWTGTDVVLETRPVDPFDVFRGQYLAIAYAIGDVPLASGARAGDTVYVSLVQNGTFWIASGVSLERPQGLFVRGTVERTSAERMQVRYGMEQYFFEQHAEFSSQNLSVHARIGSDGRGRIVELLQYGSPLQVNYTKGFS